MVLQRQLAMSSLQNMFFSLENAAEETKYPGRRVHGQNTQKEAKECDGVKKQRSAVEQ